MQENNQLTSQVSELVRGIGALTTEIRVLVTRMDHQSREFDESKVELKSLANRVQVLEIEQAEQRPMRKALEGVSKQIWTLIVSAVMAAAFGAYQVMK